MVIAKDTIVSMFFTLTDSEGKVLDGTDDNNPFEFVQGQGMIIPGLEKGVEGLKAGDEKTIIVSPEDGYGVRDKSLVVKLNRNELPFDEVTIGQEFRKVFSDGESEIYRVTGFVEDWVYLDKNHALAGVELHFKVKIVNVRPNPTR